MNNQSDTQRIVIIGGGISGLAAAHRLTELSAQEGRAREILLLEASGRAGGTVRSFRRDDFLLEAGPDSFISEKPEAVALAKRLGIEDELIPTNDKFRRSFIVRGERLRSVPEGFHLLAPSRFLPFVTSDIFSWKGKARMALDLFLPRKTDDEDESLADFVRRRLGREALERMAQPMVGGIYTADPEKLSLRATMPRFTEMERAHGSLIRAMWRARKKASNGNSQNGNAADASRGTSGARYSLFLSFKEGLQTLTDKLTERLPRDAIRLNAHVSSLTYDEEKKSWRIRINESEAVEADAVCVALPAYAAAKLLRSVDSKLADELDAIPYASTATVNLAFKRADIPHALDGFGFVVPFIERRAVLACTFSSVKFAGRAPEGYALLRAFVGGALQPENFELDETEMISRILVDLRKLLGIERAPLFAEVAKWSRSMAQYHVGHIARRERINERLRFFPTLQLAGNYSDGAGLPDCIRNGERAAARLVERK